MAKACSFTGTTVVLMADRTKKPIEDIRAGDKVLATDPETGEQEAKTVEEVFTHDDTFMDLTVDREVITTTEDHPFWSVSDRRFERADQLERGEELLTADGRVVPVSGLRMRTDRTAKLVQDRTTKAPVTAEYMGRLKDLVPCGVPTEPGGVKDGRHPPDPGDAQLLCCPRPRRRSRSHSCREDQRCLRTGLGQ